MALPAADPFTGTGALGANWTVLQGNPSRLSDQGRGTDIAANTAIWSQDDFYTDHFAQFVVAVVVDSNGGSLGPLVRVSGIAGTTQGYVLMTKSDVATITKITDGATYTTMQTTGATFANGDVGYLEIVGTTLIAKKNAVQIGTNEPGTEFTAGQAGFFIYAVTAQIDDFAADNIGATAGGMVLQHGMTGMRLEMCGGIHG